MDQYPSPYVSVVPRLLPSQSSSKKIPMSEEAYQYSDNRSITPYVSPTSMLNRSGNFPPLATRTQLMNNEGNHQDPSWVNQSFVSNNLENSSGGRSKNRIRHEPLKDNSGDIIPVNSYATFGGYPPNYENGQYESYRRYNGDDMRNPRMCPESVIITLGIIIGLFAVTALAISIYLLVRISNT